ncbi:hypothetical protein AOZ07_02825 [Glutamicibacter halophytocola]|uniref:hypothetical protein n=1 Tax=Glutamicibacter halophytocola TaxID=1933880 RepID=UPI0006D4B434|nr:hypothetical protein [Glutamicibacter halophytocola]ALG28034.1 hypothetical protein AOZ07_02825 [Glutamicibacter halophytocola]
MSDELSIDEMRVEVNEHGVLDIDQATELLDRLEQAERNADTYQTLYEQRAETLEQAEQAVARVRGLIPNDPDIQKMFWVHSDDLLRALDGDQA